ncbi:hypothetical protein C8R44DRAFT_553748, partial [Mycena epipterygia]
TRLLFTASLNSDIVLVKFSTLYCPTLHQFCHELGHAPKLLGYQHIPGGWHVVVMQYVQNASSIFTAN